MAFIAFWNQTLRETVWVSVIFTLSLFSLLGLVCKSMFDMYACWTDGVPNTTVKVPCPWYLPWYDQGMAANNSAYWHGKVKICFTHFMQFTNFITS